MADRYRFQIEATGTSTVVEHYWEPASVYPDEATYQKRQVEQGFRGIDAERAYPGDLPETKPAYAGLSTDRQNRIWVLHYLEAERLTDCVEDPREDLPGSR